MNNNQLTRWEDFGPRQRQKKSCLQKPFEDELELERRMFVFEYRLEKQITYMFFPPSWDWTDSFGDQSSLISRFERDNPGVGMYRPWGRDRAQRHVICHVLRAPMCFLVFV